MNIDYIALGEELLEYSRINDHLTHEQTIMEFLAQKQKEQDSKVVQLGNKGFPEDSRGWKLRAAINKILTEKDFPVDECKKALILQLYDENGAYDIKYTNVGMSMAECISLCELSKTLFKNDMGY